MIISITGPRPDKCGGYILPNPTYVKVCQALESKFLEYKPELVISGMALGVDMWAANIAIKNNIPVLAAIPFLGQESIWSEKDQEIYNKILSKCSKKVIVSDGGFTEAKFQIRNQYMVDNCDLLIAVYNGDPGGTKNTVLYAQSINKEIFYIEP